MTEQEFVQSGAAAWSRLSGLVGKARAEGMARLDADELIALHEGYRRAAADLAYAQTHFPGTSTVDGLNTLVGAAHGFLYASPPRRLARIVAFFAREFPALVRRHAAPIALSSALLGGATAAAYAGAIADAGLGRAFLPAQMRDAVAERLESEVEGSALPGGLGPLISTQIMLNNIQVGFTSFAGGALAGTLTVFVLVRNGLLLGALAGLFTRAGLTLPFLSLVVPHGVLEIPAIAITAGAGLVIADAILRPGEQLRRHAIKHAAGIAVRLVLGTLPVFAVAALIEGFVTPAPMGEVAKLLFGAAMLAALTAWLMLGGRAAPTGGRAP